MELGGNVMIRRLLVAGLVVGMVLLVSAQNGLLAAPVKEDPETSVELHGVTLVQALSRLAEILSIDIVLKGQDLPDHVLNLSLSGGALRSLIENTLIRYGVRSFAIEAVDVGNGKEIVYVYVITNQEDVSKAFGEERAEGTVLPEQSLTQKQRDALSSSQTEMDLAEDFGAGVLSKQQKELLLEFEEESSPNYDLGAEELTDEQVKTLRANAFWIDENSASDSSLTVNQLNQVKEKSRAIEEENELAKQPLTAAQKQLLERTYLDAEPETD